jgi:hypothetical protein
MTAELVDPCLLAVTAVMAGDGGQVTPINGFTELDGHLITAARLVEDLRLEDFLPDGSCAEP